jgi:hypothetical protein
MSRFRPYTSLRGQRAAFNTLQAWLVRCRRWHHGSSAIASFGSASHYSLCQWSSSLPLPSNCKERPGTKIADVSPRCHPAGRSARISNSAAGRSWQLKSVSPVKSVSLGFRRSVCRRKCGWPPRTRRRGVHDSREPVKGGQALDKYLEVADLEVSTQGDARRLHLPHHHRPVRGEFKIR